MDDSKNEIEYNFASFIDILLACKIIGINVTLPISCREMGDLY